MTLDELADNFSYLTEWEDKYRYLLDLGATLPPMPVTEKNDLTKVDGCMAQVWINVHVRNGKYYFNMDSDAHIVRGLQAVLYVLINGKSADEIKSLPLTDIFMKLGLKDHLSPNRRNGFLSMVGRIRRLVDC